MLKKALGGDVRILYIGSGLGISFDDFLLVEIDINVDLSSLDVDIEALVSDSHQKHNFRFYGHIFR